MTTNIELSNKLRKFKKFIGVFSKDGIPNTIGKGEAMIINFEKATESGSHWVCILGGAMDGLNLYIDSYGMAPPDSFIRLLKGENNYYKYNTSQYQSMSSIKCGEFCVYFISRFLSPRFDIYKTFYETIKPKEFEKNDLVVARLYNDL